GLQRDDDELLLSCRPGEEGVAPLVPEAVLVIDRRSLGGQGKQQWQEEGDASDHGVSPGCVSACQSVMPAGTHRAVTYSRPLIPQRLRGMIQPIKSRKRKVRNGPHRLQRPRKAQRA